MKPHAEPGGHCLHSLPVAPRVQLLAPARLKGGIRSPGVSVRVRIGSRRIITVAVVPLINSGTGRVVGALEEFQLAPGWEEADDLAPFVDGTRHANPPPRHDGHSAIVPVEKLHAMP